MTLKKIKQIIREHPAVFKALEEYDLTKKIITKTRMNFTIDKIIADRFRKKYKGKNMSLKIEKLMKDKL